MKTITDKKLHEKIKAHKKWLKDSSMGERLVLIGYNLSSSDLSNSNLRYSDLRYSNLRGSNLSNSDLRYSKLRASDLRGSNLSNSDLRYSNLRGSNLSNSNLSGGNIDYSCLPLWCGGQFKADEKICKQLVAHVVKIMELSNIDRPELISAMNEYKKGWHRESEF